MISAKAKEDTAPLKCLDKDQGGVGVGLREGRGI